MYRVYTKDALLCIEIHYDMKSASILLGAPLNLFKLQSLNRDNQQDWKIYPFFSLGQS